MLKKIDSMKLGLQQFRDGRKLSYVFFDRTEKAAVILNPVVNLLGDYKSYLAQNHLHLKWVMSTSSDEDSEGAALSLFPKEIRLNSKTSESWGVGSIQGSIFHLFEQHGRETGYFAEGILFLNDLAWLQAAKDASSLAPFKSMPPQTAIYPCLDQTGLIFSILENELSGKTYPNVNLRSVEIGIEKFRSKLSESLSDKSASNQSLFIDVRESVEFDSGHIPGIRNFPISELGLHWVELSQHKKVYVSCMGGERSLQAVRTLNYLGLSDVIHVKAGFRGWINAGYPVESLI